MAAVTITPEDLEPFAQIEQAKAGALIEDAIARAARVAPCIRDETLDVDHAAAVKAILRDAILRRNEVGAGAVTQQTAGSFSQVVDTRTTTSRVMLWPTEVAELQAICRDHNGEKPTGAYSIDMAGQGGGLHAPWCNLMFGATYCSCGADIAGEPIYG